MIAPWILLTLASGGCGAFFSTGPAPLFTIPLEVREQAAGPAIIDTGGGYELMLRDNFGLRTVGEVEVLVFGGFERVGITEGFPYRAGGFAAEADSALVGLSICECNGLGIDFFRKTGAVLGIDFPALTASFVAVVPSGGVTVPFEPPPEMLPNFQTSFVTVELAADGERIATTGLLDTGTNATLMRRGLVGQASRLSPDRQQVQITHDRFGAIRMNVLLFDTPGLPDVILGTDAMEAWSDRWYFFFARRGGTITAFPTNNAVQPPIAARESG